MAATAGRPDKKLRARQERTLLRQQPASTCAASKNLPGPNLSTKFAFSTANPRRTAHFLHIHTGILLNSWFRCLPAINKPHIYSKDDDRLRLARQPPGAAEQLSLSLSMLAGPR